MAVVEEELAVGVLEGQKLPEHNLDRTRMQLLLGFISFDIDICTIAAILNLYPFPFAQL